MDERSYRIAVIPGDGTAPEVVREGLKVLDAAESAFGFRTERVSYDLGAQRYMDTGETLPDPVLDELRQMDAIYFGAVGLPGAVKPGVLERGIILRLRFELDLYVNLRPVKLYRGVPCPIVGKGPEDIDFVVVRENTEGLYADAGGFHYRHTPDEVALQTSVNTRRGVERVIRYAYEYTRRRDKDRRLHFAGKTNVLTYAHDLWDRVFNEVGEEYPDIDREYGHVDAICFWFVQNPEWFDVIVTDNQLGDIITDLGAAIQGGMGVAASANLNPDGVSMFEPIGGTAPSFTGQDVINPMAAIGALQMMLDHLGERDAAQGVERAMEQVFPRLEGMGAGQMGYSTTEVGDMVASSVDR
ncbi:MAG TPA: 3-isopropylmalate dehydrogenase [Actinomycetota bacterium]|nr:3-isopropylmalate dehydrogenase [Actinomycetota bacterium]